MGVSEHKVVEVGCGGIDNYTNEWSNIWGNRIINDREWHHIVGVYDGKRIHIYVDGSEDHSIEASGFMSTNDDHVIIGSFPRPLEQERCWNGLIDDVRIYSYALSADEISELYKSESIKPEN